MISIRLSKFLLGWICKYPSFQEILCNDFSARKVLKSCRSPYDDIQLSGRIVAIADVFDTLTSERPYKKAWTIEEAVTFIDEESGKHFDANLVSLFRERLPEMLDIKE